MSDTSPKDAVKAVAFIHYDGEGKQRIGFGDGLVGLPEGTNLYTAPPSVEALTKVAALEDWSEMTHQPNEQEQR